MCYTSGPSATQSLLGELGSAGMKICESAFLCPSKLCVPRSPPSGAWGQGWDGFLSFWGKRQTLAFPKMEMVLSSAEQPQCTASCFRHGKLSDTLAAASLHSQSDPPVLSASFHLSSVCTAPCTQLASAHLQKATRS